MTGERKRGLLSEKRTSVLLAVAFAIVLVVFSSALLVNLYHIGNLRTSSEAIRIRQQIRHRGIRVTRLAEKEYEQALNTGECVPDKIHAFDKTYQEMVDIMRVLGLEHVNDAEHLFLNRLAERAGEMRDLLHSLVLEGQTRPRRLKPHELARLKEEGAPLVARLNQLNDTIGQSFDQQTDRTEKQAEQAWVTGLAVSWSIFAVALAVSLLAVFFAHRAIAQPIGQLVDGTKVLASGDLTSRMRAPSRGEFRVLAESFNRMAEALERNQHQLIEAEKLATIGRFAAGVAHEINNPIAVILGYVKTLLDRMPEGSGDREALAAIEEEARQCKNIVQGLLDLSRPAGKEQAETIDPDEVVRESLGLARVLQLTPGVTIEATVVNDALPLTVRRTTLRQIVLNLLTNALEALQQAGGGELRIDGYVRTGPEGIDADSQSADEAKRQFLVLSFADTGPGVPKENLPLLFDPFFTTKRGGTGLGLAITYSIVDANGGHIVVTSTEGEGTTFVISLPLAQPQPAQEGEPA